MAEPLDEIRAMMTVLLEAFPDAADQLDADGVGLNLTPNASDAYEIIADSTDIWPPVKLEWLRQAIRGPVDDAKVKRLAPGLVAPTIRAVSDDRAEAVAASLVA